MHDDKSLSPLAKRGDHNKSPSPLVVKGDHKESPSPLVGEGREGGSSHRTVATLLRDRAKTLRRNLSPPERLFWSKVRAHRFFGLGFRRQVPIGEFVADFACHEALLVIELDGHSHDGSVAGDYDAKRDEFMIQRGYRVLRLSNSDVIRDLESCLAQVIACLPPTLTLPLTGGGSRDESLSPLAGEEVEGGRS
jgi:very-short-patch-repair endonuclease